MSAYLPVINAFIEDTCVIAIVAYLLARGRMLSLLFSEPRSWRGDAYLGVILGIVGLSEIIFPGARSPYVMHTLIVAFATLVGGLRVGLIAAGTVLLGVFILQPIPRVLETALMLFTSVLVSALVHRLFGSRYSLLRGLVAGAGAQAGVVFLRQLPLGALHVSPILPHAIAGIPANGFGLLVLQMVLNDARMRAESERHRLEAEHANALAADAQLTAVRAQALVTEAQLTALRARIHPHFLFNTLTSIAILCKIAPDKAESAILRLSQLMRWALDIPPTAPVCLSDEIEYVRGYLEIEKHRLGSHLQVLWEIEAADMQIQIPPLALQTLVENAIAHGVTPKMEPGTIRIVVRSRPRHTLIAVIDDGVGMTVPQRASAVVREGGSKHGLQIAFQQLVLLYGRPARLRLFSRVDTGTLALFAIPHTSAGTQGVLEIC